MSSLLTRAAKLNQKEFAKLINEYDKQYYNNEKNIKPISDKQYDDLREVYVSKFGKLEKVGVRGDRKEVELEYFMGSLDKKKTDKDLKNWAKGYKGKFLKDDKVNGVSCLFIFDGEKIKLRKRGDEGHGSDISYLAEHISFPELEEPCDVRMELVIKKEVFEKKYAKKYSNALGMIVGLTNSKHFIQSEIRDITAIAYQLYSDGTQIDMSKQMKKLKKLGFNIPLCEIINKLDTEELQEYLFKREKEAEYEVDGLVISKIEEFELTEDKYPKHSVAFKGITESAITTVTGIDWKVSRDGSIKPTVLYEEVSLSGGHLSRATGFNAQYIKDHSIGIGSQIEVCRSGGVIPYILNVVESSDEPLFPDEEYVWRGVDIVLTNKDERMDFECIVHFFEKIGAKYVAEKTLKKIYDAGYTDIKSIIQISHEELLEIEGIKDAGATKIVESIAEMLDGIDTARVMAATNFFGRGIGERKLQAIIDKHPDFLTWELDNDDIDEEFEEKIREGGIKKDELVEAVMGGLVQFQEWLADIPEIKLRELKPKKVGKKVSKKVGSPKAKKQKTDDNDEGVDDEQSENEVDEAEGGSELEGKSVVFTGFRSKELETILKDLGAKVMTSVSKNTNILVVKEKGALSGKALKAETLGTEVLDRDSFIEKYNIKIEW